jgi:hypothetical protein
MKEELTEYQKELLEKWGYVLDFPERSKEDSTERLKTAVILESEERYWTSQKKSEEIKRL